MTYDVRQWSTTDSSNNRAAPNGWATGTMIPSEVEPTGRMMMGGAARFYTDLFKPVTTGGTSTAYTVSITQQPSSIAQPLGFAVKWDQTCGATPTLNVNSKGAKSLYWPDGTQATTGDLPANTYSLIFYDGTNYVIYSLNKQAVSVSAASESTAGKAELATQAETNTGTDDARIVTPLKLSTWAPAVATVTAVTTDKILIADASDSGKIKQALVSDVAAAIPATKIIAGTTLSKNPLATTSVTTQAHGLAGEPKFVRFVLECVTNDGTWDVGDRIDLTAAWGLDKNTASELGMQVAIDATNVRLMIAPGTGGVLMYLVAEDASAMATLTAANWKAEIIPYYWA